MINKDLVAASSEVIILSILCNGDNYGYSIIQKVKQYSNGQMQWTDGMIYPVLHKLADKEFIDFYWGQSETGRKRKYYKITSEGQQALKDKLSQWTEVSATIQSIGAVNVS